MRIGSAEEYSLAEAQEHALRHRQSVKDGLDPVEMQTEARKVPTFAQFVEQDFLPHIRTYKRSWTCDVSLLNNHLLPVLGKQYLDAIMHDLRHSFASILINSGRSLYEVQHLLGHTQVKTTERYAHLQQDTLMKAANVVAALVGTASPQRPLAGLIGG